MSTKFRDLKHKASAAEHEAYKHPSNMVCVKCYAEVYRNGYPTPDTRECADRARDESDA